MSARAIAAFVGVGLGAVALYFALPSGVVQSTTFVAIGLVCVSALARGILRNGTPVPKAWRFALSGVALAVAGDVVWVLMDSFDSTSSAVGPADVLYVAGYLLLIAFVVTLATRIGGGWHRVALLDSAIVASAVLVATWDVIAISSGTGDVLTAYPVLDAIMLAALARLLVSGAWSNVSYRFLVGAAGLLLTADMGYVELGRGYAAGSWPDGVWLSAYVFLAAAALHPSVRELGLPATERLTGGRRPWLVIAAALALPISRAVDRIFGGIPSAGNLVMSAFLFALLLARFVVLVRELEHDRSLLAEKEEWFRTLTSHSLDVLVVLDRNGRATYYSASLLNVTGYLPEELVGGDPLDLVHPDDREHLRGTLSEAIRSGREAELIEFRFRVRDGSYRLLEAAARNLIDDPRVGGLVITARDVTERKRADERFRTVFEHAPDAIVVIGDDGRIISPNPECARLSGYSEEELIGRSIMDLVFHEDRDRIASAWVDLFRNAAPRDVEWRLRRKNGDGIWTLANVSVVPDATGGPATVIAQLLDITERRNAEAEVAEQNERLVRADRLKNELIAVISHDLRTPLTSIMGYAELLEDDATGPLNDEQRRFLGILERNAERLMSLVDGLLLISRLESGTIELSCAPLVLRDLVEECVEAARPAADGAGVEIRIEAPDPVPIVADSGRLAQLLDNLVSNAIKFTPAGGRIEVRLQGDEERAVLEVEDTGIGISADDQEHLFERFFRSPGVQALPGNGLGLAIAQAVAQAHGGSIAVSSSVGAGTTFTATLPTEAAAARAA